MARIDAVVLSKADVARGPHHMRVELVIRSFDGHGITEAERDAIRDGIVEWLGEMHYMVDVRDSLSGP